MVEDKSPHAFKSKQSYHGDPALLTSDLHGGQLVIRVLGSGQKSSDLICCVRQHVDRFNRLRWHSVTFKFSQSYKYTTPSSAGMKDTELSG